MNHQCYYIYPCDGYKKSLDSSKIYWLLFKSIYSVFDLAILF